MLTGRTRCRSEYASCMKVLPYICTQFILHSLSKGSFCCGKNRGVWWNMDSFGELTDGKGCGTPATYVINIVS